MSDKPRSIRATRIGGHAHRYLMVQERTGHVVSSFSGGVNLLFEGGEAFVPVQASSVPLHPWAIEIPGESLRFAEGMPVSVKDGELSIENTHIPFSNAQVKELSLPRFSPEGAAIAQRNFPILSRFVQEARNMHPTDPFQREIDASLARWQKAGDPTVLVNLIGLGAGSTPSGDDVLVGIIAGLSFFENMDDKVREALSQLRSGVQEVARGRTSLPSAQMLLSACDSAFAEPILALLKSLGSAVTSEDELLDKAEHIAQLGHHSGIAILSGLTRICVSS